MRASELRIGNLVSGNRIVAEISATYFTDTDRLSTLFRDAEPIPLTEEWLIKLGFTPIDLNEGLAKDHVIILRPDFNDSPEHHGWYYVFCEDYMQRTVILKTVNQLQNLYFALTGEELKIDGIE